MYQEFPFCGRMGTSNFWIGQKDLQSKGYRSSQAAVWLFFPSCFMCIMSSSGYYGSIWSTSNLKCISSHSQTQRKSEYQDPCCHNSNHRWEHNDLIVFHSLPPRNNWHHPSGNRTSHSGRLVYCCLSASEGGGRKEGWSFSLILFLL